MNLNRDKTILILLSFMVFIKFTDMQIIGKFSIHLFYIASAFCWLICFLLLDLTKTNLFFKTGIVVALYNLIDTTFFPHHYLIHSETLYGCLDAAAWIVSFLFLLIYIRYIPSVIFIICTLCLAIWNLGDELTGNYNTCEPAELIFTYCVITGGMFFYLLYTINPKILKIKRYENRA